jgi:TonB family protein
MNGSVVEQVLPDVSPKASSTIRGKVGVSVRVTTDKNGEVTNAELDSPSGSKYFSKLALQAARRWRFKAAQVDGRAVSSEWIVRFQFAQTETKVTSVEAVP